MRKSILIADDSEVIRKITRIYLESHPGFEVCGEAVDGVDALTKVDDLKPDLIILDLAMPQMNGLQAARELKIRKSGVLVILFTLYSDDMDTSGGLPTGVNAVVSKVEGFPNLMKEVEHLLVAA